MKSTGSFRQTYKTIKRCPWPGDDLLMVAYHDQEWGKPIDDDRTIFEFLVLEAFQAGLSWRIILHKREHFKEAFKNFDYRKIANFTSKDRVRLVRNAGIVRNRAKIAATIQNARLFMEVRKEFGTFSKYMWQWVKGQPIRHRLKTMKDYPAVIPEAEAWAQDLKKRGFKFLGPTVIYAHMQAVGMVNDHVVHCFRYREV
jgi:DNA-3-methyladenine glycosylase I